MTDPAAIAVQILMAALSTFITEGFAALDDENAERVRAALATGKLRIEIDTPPLTIRCSVAEDDDVPGSFLFAVSDDRAMWATWARDLAQRAQ